MTATLAPSKSPTQRMRERIFIRCKQLRLSRFDRLEIASYVLGYEVQSFDQLGPVEMARLIDGFETTYYTMHMLMERQRGQRV